MFACVRAQQPARPSRLWCEGGIEVLGGEGKVDQTWKGVTVKEKEKKALKKRLLSQPIMEYNLQENPTKKQKPKSLCCTPETNTIL